MSVQLQYFPASGFYYDVESPLTGGSTDQLQFLVISAFVTFTPRVPIGWTAQIANLDLGNGNSGSASLALPAITARIHDGQLSTIDTTDTPGIQLLSNSAPIASALAASDISALYYDVSFTDVVYAEENQTITNFAFEASTDTTPICITDPTLTRYAYQTPQQAVSQAAAPQNPDVISPESITGITSTGISLLTAAGVAAVVSFLGLGADTQLNEYSTFSAFPGTGVANQIYYAQDTHELYVWNTSTSAYQETSGGASVPGAGMVKSNGTALVDATASDFVAPLSAQSANITASTTPTINQINVYDATSGNLTPTLPALSGETVGAQMIVQKYSGDTTTHTVVLTCAGSDTFDNASTSRTLELSGEFEELQVISVSGTKHWKVVSDGKTLGSLDNRYPQVADYVVSVSGSTYTATPRPTSSLTAYSGTNFTTVLQAAVTALTPTGGGVGSAGGKIHINKGSYTLGNQVVITGWEGITGSSNIPHSQLIIEGEGLATQITQSTSGQNAFVVKNCANVSFLDMFGSMGSGALSFILGDSSGAQSEMSFWGGTIRVNVFSQSTSAPAIYIRNFFDLDVPKLWAYNASYHGIILENNSSTTNYGNSFFGHVRAVGSSSTPYAGLVLQSTNGSTFINLNEFNNYQSVGAYYGIYCKGAAGNTWTKIDVEGVAVGVMFDSATSTFRSQDNTVLSGYILPTATGIGVQNTANTSNNSVHAHVDTSGASPGAITAISDANQFNISNEYSIVVYLNADVAAAVAGITTPSHHRLHIEAVQGEVYHNVPAGTVGATATAGDSSTQLATTAFVTSGVGAEVATLAAGVGIPFIATNYYRLNIEDPSAAFALINGDGSGNIFVSGRTATLTQLGVEITSAGSTGAVIRFGLFAISGSTAVLVADFGTAAATSTGFVSATGSAPMVAGQTYMAVAVSQGAPATAPTVRSCSSLVTWGTQMGFSSGSSLLTGIVGLRIGGGGATTGGLSSGTLQAAGSSGDFPCIVGYCAT